MTKLSETSDKDVLDFIEASNNVIESQKVIIKGLQKQASEAQAKAAGLEQMFQRERERVLELSKKAQEHKEVPPSTSWGKGEPKGITKTNMRNSERTLLNRLGIPVN